MAKTPKKVAPKEPEFSTYTIKGMDRGLWTRFTKKIHDDGRKVNWTLERLIQEYTNGSIRLQG